MQCSIFTQLHCLVFSPFAILSPKYESLKYVVSTHFYNLLSNFWSQNIFSPKTSVNRTKDFLFSLVYFINIWDTCFISAAHH